MIIVLIGPPGSGKGTQGRILSEKNNFYYFDTGSAVRRYTDSLNKDNSVGSALQHGSLLNDNLINKIVSSSFSYRPDQVSILDGFPRTLVQAQYLTQNYKDAQIIPVFFFIDSNAIISRIINRYMCSECGAIYSASDIPMKDRKKCDVCSSNKFITRKDDNVETLEVRINNYQKTYDELRPYYKNYSIDIKADQKPSDVTKEFTNKIMRLVKNSK